MLARELDTTLKGRIIETFRLDENRILTITLSRPDPGRLKFLHDPALPLLSYEAAGRHRLRPSEEPPPMPRFEEHLSGGSVLAIEQIGLDRVMRMAVIGGGNVTFRLYFELTLPHPNLFLTDADDTIVATLYRAGTRTRARTLVRGQSYVPPAAQAKVHPFEVTPEYLGSLPWQADGHALSKTILGIGPFLSREIIWRAEQYGSISRAFDEIVVAHRSGNIEPCVFVVSQVFSRARPRIGTAWYKPLAPWISEHIPARSLSGAASIATDMFVEAAALERRRVAAAKTIRREIEKWEKARRVPMNAKQEMELAARLRKFGELIVANLATLKKGPRQAKVRDIYSEVQADITIPLEPHLTPQANADAYFKKARKARRRAKHADERIETARARLKELRELAEEIREACPGDERLSEIETAISRPASPARMGKREVDERASDLGIKPRRYVVSGGWTVLVGRSAKENDVLTHRYATPSDLWFHARHAQGSHVLLRRGRKKTHVTRHAIAEAARIAAYYSKARTSKHVAVSYTEKRYVKKVRKGPPGMCTMLREKVVFVDPGLP